MSQKLPVNDFICVEDIPELNEDFIKTYNDENNEIYFLLKLIFNIPETYIILYNDKN